MSIKEPIQLKIITNSLEIHEAFKQRMSGALLDSIAGLKFCAVSSESDGKNVKVHLQQFFTLSKIKPDTAWTGEGLPPVGTVCELTERVLLADAEDSDWFDEGTQVEVGGHAFFKTAVSSVCTICVTGENFTGTIAAECLRPIRTSEQIAAEVREKDCEEMLAIIKASPWGMTAGPHEVIALLYDADYRKFEITED